MLKTIASNIRAERARKGWSQEELAKKCELHINSIGLIERGMKDPRVTTLHKIAMVLGVTIDELCKTGEEK